MHAVISRVTIDPAKADSARSMLEDQVIPALKAAPGFIAGYWTEPVDGHAVSMVVFDDEAGARAAAPAVGPAPNGAVVFDSVEVREVVAHA